MLQLDTLSIPDPVWYVPSPQSMHAADVAMPSPL
jgi:hypothetical protein